MYEVLLIQYFRRRWKFRVVYKRLHSANEKIEETRELLLCCTSLQSNVLPINIGRDRIFQRSFFFFLTLGYYFSGKVSNVSR
jgi:hypothetical protein